nr:immunoglobulin heavy chain junction region [Macaca mulatta]
CARWLYSNPNLLYVW